VGLSVLAHPIIALIYQRGDFRPYDTDHTAAVLAFYAIGLAGYAAIRILAPAFYALNDSRTPMMISLLSILINFIMNWALVGILKERGLALSTSVVALMNFGLLYVIMRRKIGGIDGRRTAITVGKIALASAVMGVLCWVVSYGLGNAFGGGAAISLWARLAIVVGSVGAGAAVFYGCAYMLGIPELEAAVATVTRRLGIGRERG
jgi:putative peptidoglycan lipid II flippase